VSLPLGFDLDGVAADEFAREDLLRQRIFQLRPDCALQRARAADRIETDVRCGARFFAASAERRPARSQCNGHWEALQ